MKTKYPEIGREEFLARMSQYSTSRHMAKIVAAYRLSKYGHRGQSRESGVRYFEHPRTVAWILVVELGVTDWLVIVLALLHDILEDTFLLTEFMVKRMFGRRVWAGLDLLTIQDKGVYVQRLEQEAGWRELLVKLVDRLHNLRTLDACEIEKRRRKVDETKRDYWPLLERLEKVVPRKYRQAVERLRGEIAEALDLVEGGLQE